MHLIGRLRAAPQLHL